MERKLVAMKPSTHQRLKVIAALEGKTIDEVVRLLLAKYEATERAS
jgi:hypothetical protein